MHTNRNLTCECTTVTFVRNVYTLQTDHHVLVAKLVPELWFSHGPVVSILEVSSSALGPNTCNSDGNFSRFSALSPTQVFAAGPCRFHFQFIVILTVLYFDII
jgi:hypothetical protein